MNQNIPINQNNLKPYFSKPNIKFIYTEIDHLSRIKLDEAYIDELLSLMKNIAQKLIIKDNIEFTIKEINNLTIKLAIVNLAKREFIEIKKNKGVRVNVDDESNINSDRMLKNLIKSKTTGNITLTNTEETQFVTEFKDFVKTIVS